MKRVISIILLVSLALSLGSCKKSIFPKGYTGGLGIPRGSGKEIFWAETFDEVVVGAGLLKEHESTFLGGYIFNCDGEGFDVKYCFIFDHEKDTITYGDSPYDRWAELVDIRAYGFFTDVTIDELVYSDIGDYEYVTIEFTEFYYDEYSDEYIDPIFFECRWDDDTMEYYGSYNEDKLFSIKYNSKNQPIPGDSTLLSVMQTLVYIGEDKEE